MSKSILVVDDSASLRSSLEAALRNAGFEVTLAEDGVDAVRILDGRGFDLVITDVNMPQMDGITLIRRLRVDHRHKYTPVLMLTTSSEVETMKQGKEAGATGWMSKPYNPEILIAVARRLVI